MPCSCSASCAQQFISGQRVLAERESCGYSKELVTYKGEINNHLIAAELVVSIPDDYSSDVASCSVLGGIRAGDRTEDDPCRVPVPNVVSNSSRLTCATSPFTFIDEYFTDVGESSQTVDLGSVRSNTFNLTYTYLAPLCMKAIVVALPTDYRVLQKIQHCNGVSDRTWPPSWVNDIDGVYMTESLLLDTPTIDSDYEDTVYGKADDIDERAIFCESDKFNVSFHLVEVYPTDEAGLLCDWPEDFEDDSNSLCTLNYYPENDFSYERGTAAPKNQGSRVHEAIVFLRYHRHGVRRSFWRRDYRGHLRLGEHLGLRPRGFRR